MKIETVTLDSNVFRNQSFIDWLADESAPHETHIFPLIIYIEVLVWYEMCSLTRKDLDEDLTLIKTQIKPFSLDYIDSLMENIRNTKHLPFRHHARDFLIGTLVQRFHSTLITHNKRHFEWLSSVSVYTPEEFIKHVLEI